MEKSKKIKIEYGAMSSRHSLKCENKFIGYASIVLHYSSNPGLVTIYSPEELKKDSWLNFSGQTQEKLDALFQEFGGFEPFLKANLPEIKKCRQTIKKIV